MEALRKEVGEEAKKKKRRKEEKGPTLCKKQNRKG